ncbi:hypothetical protein Y032_0074g868 [Ancylostoma ceylanicum]|uniref:Uncharacterized protein n=1 Tax=Ancylostoma ceylanicum TaxID=53326 RepID=A0A016TVS3_9BILA|nr:hypothetical protein Y032_0074g868 [Ancylostoma ceylanicum]
MVVVVRTVQVAHIRNSPVMRLWSLLQNWAAEYADGSDTARHTTGLIDVPGATAGALYVVACHDGTTMLGVVPPRQRASEWRDGSTVGPPGFRCAPWWWAEL